jgi:RND family efflux transporter MFP subunit
MKLDKQRISWMLASLVLLSGCGKNSPSVEKKPIEVKVTTVQRSDISSRQSFSGTIEEENGSELSFPVAGTVKHVAVSAGQRVSKGQLIAVVDDATFQSSIDMAAATLEQARDAYNRLKILHDNNSLPDIQWVEAESKLKQAESAYAIARKNASDTRLYAPFSGYISQKNVEIGNNVMPGSPVVKLVTVDRVKVCISVPETEISKINIGESIEIVVPALGNSSFEGRIKEKGVAANALSRSYEVKAEVANPTNALLPGMLCTLYLANSGEDTSEVLVSRHVVQLDSENHNFVWINDGGKAMRRYVELGEFVGDSVAVISGLTEGEQIIVEGQQKVSDNMNIKVIQ